MRQIFLCALLLLVCAGLSPVLAAAPPETALLAGTVHTRPDPESRGKSAGGAIRLRADRYGNVCLIGTSRVPGCAFIAAKDVVPVIRILRQAADRMTRVRPVSDTTVRRQARYVLPLPARPGHPRRHTGMTVKTFVPANTSRGYVALTLHDAQIGGGGEYFLRPAEAEQLAILLTGVPAVSQRLDIRLVRYEKQEEARGRYAPPPPRNDSAGDFIFSLLPLLGFFL
ncbi:MAG: hypothetical protein M3O22_07085 [Pseudomonadota bacterium]|nr:hypothetical protein [Pseudomonadota bacterium]